MTCRNLEDLPSSFDCNALVDIIPLLHMLSYKPVLPIHNEM